MEDNYITLDNARQLTSTRGSGHRDRTGGSMNPFKPYDYCPCCCVWHVTNQCPEDGESAKQYAARMDRLAQEWENERSK